MIYIYSIYIYRERERERERESAHINKRRTGESAKRRALSSVSLV